MRISPPQDPDLSASPELTLIRGGQALRQHRTGRPGWVFWPELSVAPALNGQPEAKNSQLDADSAACKKKEAILATVRRVISETDWFNIHKTV